MGTDIHLYVEKRNKETGDWEGVEPPFYIEKWGGWYAYAPDWESEEHDKYPDPAGRNYNVFAFLADVRNGRGFAGVHTHTPITPQFPDRGMPEDSSYIEGTLDEEEGEMVGQSFVWLGEHSITWATLRELRDAPWGMEFDTGGVIHSRQYDEFEERGVPKSWAGLIGDGNTTITEEEFLLLRDSGEVDFGPEPATEQEKRMAAGGFFSEGVNVSVRWKWQPVFECGFRSWLYTTWMQDLADSVGGNPDHVRVTMGFDS